MNISGAIEVGCCGWAGAQAQYFAQFPVIEIQSTFYDPPAAKLAERWRTIAPPDFTFCLKAWQLITHSASSPTYRRLRKPVTVERRAFCGSFQDTDEVWQAWIRTLEIATAARAKVVLFQCPPSFKATRENVTNTGRFFRKIGPQGFRCAWEPRGEWPAALIRNLCAEYNLIHCVDPLMSRCVDEDILYWRLHGGKDYRHRYTDEDLEYLADLTFEKPFQKAYILFNNVSMKDDAARFQKLITRRSGMSLKPPCS